jgi:hypothetical protein
MIVLTKGEASKDIIVTLNEKRTLESGYYLFVFTNFTTRDIVNKIFNFSEDESSYPDRYNEFPLAVSALFDDYSTGQWLYEVYEQASSSNTNVTGLNKVEMGVMVLNPETEFTRDQYNEATTFKQYAG